MRTASGLTVVAIGAILAFAVTTDTPLVNVHIVGWVLILTGIVGLVIPKKGYGWLRRRIVLRPGQRGPVVSRVDETRYPPSVIRYPDTRPAGDEQDIGTTAGLVDPRDPDSRRVSREAAVRYPSSPGESETIEEFTQE